MVVKISAGAGAIVAVLLFCGGMVWYTDSMAHAQIERSTEATANAVTDGANAAGGVFTAAGGLLVGLLEALLWLVGVAAILLVVAGVGYLLYFLETLRLERRKKLAEVERAELSASYDILKAAAGEQVFRLGKGHTTALHLGRGDWERWNIAHATARPSAMLPAQSAPSPATHPPVGVLPALADSQRCLIVGASNAGKTTLLQHLVAAKMQDSRVVVIDPHAYPDKWPGCQVVGAGRDYATIDQALTGLIELMTTRYDEIGRGLVPEMGHERVTVVIDEWRAIAYNVKGGGDCIKTLLTESRKAAFSVFVGTHSERVRALGLEGEGDLKDGFLMVRLTVEGGERRVTVDYGDGQQPATLPGPFAPEPALPPTRPVLELTPPEPDPTETQIRELSAQGLSVSAIAREVFNGDGGNQLKKVRAILAP